MSENKSGQNGFIRHYFLEYYQCKPSIIDNLELLRNACVETALEQRIYVIRENFIFYSEALLGGTIISREFNFNIQAWPEKKLVLADLLIFDPAIKQMNIIRRFKRELKARNFLIMETKRGMTEK